VLLELVQSAGRGSNAAGAVDGTMVR
jgi:hypothetical protein